MLRILHCLENRLTDGGKVVSPSHRTPSIQAEVYSRALKKTTGIGCTPDSICFPRKANYAFVASIPTDIWSEVRRMPVTLNTLPFLHFCSFKGPLDFFVRIQIYVIMLSISAEIWRRVLNIFCFHTVLYFFVFLIENTTVEIRCADHATPSIRKKNKLAVTSPASGGRSVGIVRSGTEATEFIFFSVLYVGRYVKWSRI
jgi:hypothetical protein